MGKRIKLLGGSASNAPRFSPDCLGHKQRAFTPLPTLTLYVNCNKSMFRDLILLYIQFELFLLRNHILFSPHK